MAIDATVTSAITALEAAIAAAGTLQGASQQVLSPISTAVSAALSAIDAQCTALEASINQSSVGGISVGTPAPQLVQTLITQTQAVTDLALLKQLRGYVSRIGVNVENAPG